jgi:transcriptional regulator with XRE-family HTH domain
MNISHIIKSLRIQKKLEPIHLAELLDVSINTYRKYERNEATPDINMLEKIAEIYDISIVDLLKNNSVAINNKDNKIENNLFINQISEKLIEQYDCRLEEKEEIIKELKKTIDELKSKLN